MRRGRNTKTIIIVMCLFVVAVMSGSMFRTYKLINASKPFIELSGSIGTAVGNAEQAYLSAKPTPTPQAEQGQAQIQTQGQAQGNPSDFPAMPTPQSGQEQGTSGNQNGSTGVVVPTLTPGETVEVLVSGDKILVEGMAYKSGKQFADLLEKKYVTYQRKTVIVVDDYAETHVYKAVRNLLKKHNVAFEEKQNQ